jgi:hypothetical protein
MRNMVRGGLAGLAVGSLFLSAEAGTCEDKSFDCGSVANAPTRATLACAAKPCTDDECCIETCGDIYMHVPGAQWFNCAADETKARDGLIEVGLTDACAAATPPATPCTTAECCEDPGH